MKFLKYKNFTPVIATKKHISQLPCLQKKVCNSYKKSHCRFVFNVSKFIRRQRFKILDFGGFYSF